jgi:excisionase family DNA binding protein
MLTLEDAADRLGIHVTTLRRWIRERRVPSYRVGTRFVRVRWDQLLEALEQAPASRA